MLFVAEVGDAEQGAVAASHLDERRDRLVVEVGVGARLSEVRLDRVRVGAPVDDPVLGPVLRPDELLNPDQPVMGPDVDLVQEQRELAVERRRRVVVGELRAHRRAHEDDPGHAHLDVLGVLEVAVVDVGARMVRGVEVRERPVHAHRDRQLRCAVEDRDRVPEAVPVDRVRVVEVRAADEADVREVELEARVLGDGDDRGGNLRLPLRRVHDGAQLSSNPTSLNPKT